MLDEKQLAERTLAWLDGRKSNGGVAVRVGDSWLSARWECWAGGRVRCWTDEKQLAERTLAVLDGQKSNGGGARRAGDSWLSARSECWAGGRVLDRNTVALLDGRETAG